LFTAKLFRVSIFLSFSWPVRAAACAAVAWLLTPGLHAADAAAPAASTATARFLIQEFRVEGVHTLKSGEIEEAVYPFLGPERTADDVERARVAIEALYRAKGYQATFVQVPAQDAANGVVAINVTEGVISRTRVRGSRYSSPTQLKQDVPSLAEGQPLNFNHIARELARLNQVPERQITPEIKAGAEPGSLEVDLKVEEAKPPLAANVELNNRNSANTSSLRLNAGASYGNLWQRGHTLGFSYQTAPEQPADSKVMSGYYLFRPAGVENLTLQLLATKQESDVSTLGGSAVAGRGTTLGTRAIFALPGDESFYHTLAAGLDHKQLDQDLVTGTSVSRAPVQYYAVSFNYSATWLTATGSTEFNLTPTLSLRGQGSDDTDFGTRRNGASGSFAYLRGELARTQQLPFGFDLYLRGQAQVAGQPLIDSEQFSGGGLDTVRGYFESEVAGDDAVAGTVELRSPPLLPLFKATKLGDWRVHGFVDASQLVIQQPLPAQTARFNLIGAGFGTRLKLKDHFTGSLDAGWPLLDEGQTTAGELRVNFSLGASY
jgi:hemolysin activation/secretion protein